MPVWAEVLGDLETPVAAFAKLVGTSRASCSSRSSTASGGAGSRSSAATRRRRWCCATGGSTIDGDLPPSVPTDRGMLAAIEALLSVYTSPVIDDLPPLHGGVMGYLGYDVIREVERLPDVPPDDHGLPDAVMSVIGSLAAFDHWRQRVYLIESVRDARPDRRRARRRLRRRRGASARRDRPPRPAAAVRAGRPAGRR